MFVAAVRFIVAAVEPDTFPVAKYTDPFVDVTFTLPVPVVDKIAAPVAFESRVKVISEMEVNVEEFRKNDGAASERAPTFEVTMASESVTYRSIPQKYDRYDKWYYSYQESLTHWIAINMYTLQLPQEISHLKGVFRSKSIQRKGFDP